ncbi:zinc finger CCCH domain-containing protein 11A-like isoform X2 [Sitophilus oryzae]|nr:zinc finger CCCH domain-containing protein 11A-like isoform X2 [Sitophilus oryzae]
MTDLESPKKTNDCYFYYYSTCSKGDSCGFRHEPSALGCETMCAFWKEGKCLNVHCNFRHMELRKNRKAIPCYWETQPGGCLKPHCPFMHQKSGNINQRDEKIDRTDNGLPENCNQASSFKGSLSGASVDSLVVNFEEESDNETTPIKLPVIKGGTPKVKSLDEIKLEKIAAACAAYYSYPTEELPSQSAQSNTGEDLRNRIIQRVNRKQSNLQLVKRKLTSDELAHILGDDTLKTQEIDVPRFNNKPSFEREKSPEFKIKSLAEIRAERTVQSSKRFDETEEKESPNNAKKRKHSPIRLERNKILKTDSGLTKETLDEAEVTSTSTDEPDTPTEEKQPVKPLRKLNLKKVKSVSEEVHKDSPKELMDTTELSDNKLQRSSSNKTLDESELLLDDNDDDINVNLKAEDELLNEIDNLLDD